MYVHGGNITPTPSSTFWKEPSSLWEGLTAREIDVVKKIQRNSAGRATNLAGSKGLEAGRTLNSACISRYVDNGISSSRTIGGLPDSVLSSILALVLQAEEQVEGGRHSEYEDGGTLPLSCRYVSDSGRTFRTRSITSNMWRLAVHEVSNLAFMSF